MISRLAEIALMIPYSILGAFIGQRFGRVAMFACAFVGSFLASILISLL